MEHLIDYVKYFFLSMIPFLELRFALPLAIAAEGLNPVIAYLVCVIGNCLPVPFLVRFVRPVFDWMKNSSVWIKGKLSVIDSRTEKMDKIPRRTKIWRGILKFFLKPAEFLHRIVEKLENKAHSKAGTIKKYEMFGLFVFVAIPLPGTGAWSGSLIAAVLGMRIKDSVPMICLGVLAAGILMTLGASGVRLLGEFIVSLF